MVPFGGLLRAKTFEAQWGFKRQWRSACYHTGDIYQDELQEKLREQWKITEEESGPYLKYLRIISSEWPQLRLLADFMEVGTDPLRWKNFHGDDKINAYTYPEDHEGRGKRQSERAQRTNVGQLEYLNDNTVKLVGQYTTPEQLTAALRDSDKRGKRGLRDRSQVGLRLFVVEDLSREVIERLGYHFDIDPDFFRSHIMDYAWFNIRDPFWDPPSLYMNTARRDWHQVRFCRARYFPSPATFSKGQDAVNQFNVGRKLYDDENKAYWDTNLPDKGGTGWLVRAPMLVLEHIRSRFTTTRISDGNDKMLDRIELLPTSNPCHRHSDGADDATRKLDSEEIDGKVGLMRTRAAFWKKRDERNVCDIGASLRNLAHHAKRLTNQSRMPGVLLLDPTIKEGFPLWRGYRNWDPMPSAQASQHQLNSCVPSLTRRGTKPPSLFEDFMYWAQRPHVFSLSSLDSKPDRIHQDAVVPGRPGNHTPAGIPNAEPDRHHIEKAAHLEALSTSVSRDAFRDQA
ncbi:hypothetical protein NPX13_g8301 [Xylaria arbuscula]|uniref:Uncharacterized protein n=1 Tax=Xylaria arbuscula TaxID=114810 RepID=A0A9W8N8Y1_9PEZI|nr:hypothetical protein NPX13_g8301 [Xylaria arbuscula]